MPTTLNPAFLRPLLSRPPPAPPLFLRPRGRILPERTFRRVVRRHREPQRQLRTAHRSNHRSGMEESRSHRAAFFLEHPATFVVSVRDKRARIPLGVRSIRGGHHVCQCSAGVCAQSTSSPSLASSAVSRAANERCLADTAVSAIPPGTAAIPLNRAEDRALRRNLRESSSNSKRGSAI